MAAGLLISGLGLVLVVGGFVNFFSTYALVRYALVRSESLGVLLLRLVINAAASAALIAGGSRLHAMGKRPVS